MPGGPTRIAIPLLGFNRSGGVQMLLAAAHILAHRGHAVTFLVPDGRATNPPSPLAEGVRVQSVDVGRSRVPTLLAEVLALARAARGFDLLIANYYPTAYAAWLAGRLGPRPPRAVYFVQGLESMSHGWLAPASRPGRALRWALARGSYTLSLPRVCTTRWLASRTGRSPVRIAPYGINLSTFSPATTPTAHEPLRIGVVGRTAPAKGLADLYAAWDGLDHNALELVVATTEDVPLPSSGGARVVRGAGPSEMADFYRACDIFVQPSWIEGFCLPALEAMACGCAVVTTDCGGVGEFARHEQNALVVPVQAPAEIRRAVHRLVANPGLRRRLAADGVLTAADYPAGPRLEALADALVNPWRA